MAKFKPVKGVVPAILGAYIEINYYFLNIIK